MLLVLQMSGNLFTFYNNAITSKNKQLDWTDKKWNEMIQLAVYKVW